MEKELEKLSIKVNSYITLVCDENFKGSIASHVKEEYNKFFNDEYGPRLTMDVKYQDFKNERSIANKEEVIEFLSSVSKGLAGQGFKNAKDRPQLSIVIDVANKNIEDNKINKTMEELEKIKELFKNRLYMHPPKTFDGNIVKDKNFYYGYNQKLVDQDITNREIREKYFHQQSLEELTNPVDKRLSYFTIVCDENFNGSMARHDEFTNEYSDHCINKVQEFSEIKRFINEEEFRKIAAEMHRYTDVNDIDGEGSPTLIMINADKTSNAFNHKVADILCEKNSYVYDKCLAFYGVIDNETKTLKEINLPAKVDEYVTVHQLDQDMKNNSRLNECLAHREGFIRKLQQYALVKDGVIMAIAKNQLPTKDMPLQIKQQTIANTDKKEKLLSHSERTPTYRGGSFLLLRELHPSLIRVLMSYTLSTGVDSRATHGICI